MSVYTFLTSLTGIQRAQTFGICRPTHVYHMNQRICMTQVIQEFISQTPSLVCPRDKARNVQKLDRNGSSSLEATSVVRFALIRNIESLACAFDLKVANGALRVNGGETKGCALKQAGPVFKGMRQKVVERRDRLTGNSLHFKNIINIYIF